MASSSGALNEELQCSICLDVFTDPVTAPCGHNFCRTCLNKCWTNTQTWCCPFCKETFSRRPDLEINTTSDTFGMIQRAMFREGGSGTQPLPRGTDQPPLPLPRKQTLQRSQVNMLLRAARNHSVAPEHNTESFVQHFKKLNLGRSEVFCDICDGRKQKAVKSCLTCQSSYCETHLEPHHRVQRLKKHKLINAVENLEDYICQKHQRPLELFCRDDQTSVCLSCTEGDHRTHDTVPIEEESQEKKALSSEVESAARALIDVLARGLAPSSSSGLTPLPTLPEPENRVRQALKRQFQSMFETENDQPRGKKRFPAVKPGNVKKTDFLIYVLSEQTLFAPKGDEDLKLVHAGLGKRLLTLPDSFKHSEIVTLLEEEFPKLKTLQGGWMFYKSTGGGEGRRKLSIIPTDSDGYSTRLLKSASNNGKNMLFVVPLQEQLSIEPLPFDSVEFAKMPQSNCMKCGRKIPLPLLPLHIKECKVAETESVTDVTVLDEDENVSEATDQPSSLHTDLEQSSQMCPICQICLPTDVLLSHASTCGEGGWTFSGSDSPSTSTREELSGPSTAQTFTSLSAAWKYEMDPQKASRMFCEELLSQNAYCPSLSLLINQFGTVDEQDSTLISFYKMNSANWSAPLRCSLIGDSAVGKGVNRHVLSMVMQKLKTGFTLNLGSSTTALFEGEKNHRVPSASAVLRDSNLFQMAGRMIGHSFLHGGPCLSGLSLPVVILLTGGNADSAASALTLQDCPDIDHRETISLLKKLTTQLTEEEMTRLTDLCLFWDLPVPSLRNRDWLFQQLLSHAVLGRVKCQIKDLRKGIKDTGIWPLLSQRLDSHHIVFPRESVRDITSQGILQKIVWPKPVDNVDEDNDDSITVEKMCVITGYMRKFIEEASPTMLNHLMKFWVGWELPEENLALELVTAKFPVAYTCFKTLRLPCHYKSYAAFRVDMLMCLNSVNSGFGRV